MTRDLLDEIKTKWNIPVTLPMSVPWGKDDVVWLVQEVERLRAENERLRETLQALVDEKLVCNVREGDGSYIDVSAWCRAVLNGGRV